MGHTANCGPCCLTPQAFDIVAVPSPCPPAPACAPCGRPAFAPRQCPPLRFDYFLVLPVQSDAGCVLYAVHLEAATPPLAMWAQPLATMRAQWACLRQPPELIRPRLACGPVWTAYGCLALGDVADTLDEIVASADWPALLAAFGAACCVAEPPTCACAIAGPGCLRLVNAVFVYAVMVGLCAAPPAGADGTDCPDAACAMDTDPPSQAPCPDVPGALTRGDRLGLCALGIEETLFSLGPARRICCGA